MMDYMMDNNQIDLPEEFLKKYLKASNENLNDEISWKKSLMHLQKI
jgi:hypothetical protein